MIVYTLIEFELMPSILPKCGAPVKPLYFEVEITWEGDSHDFEATDARIPGVDHAGTGADLPEWLLDYAIEYAEAHCDPTIEFAEAEQAQADYEDDRWLDAAERTADMRREL